VAPICHAPAGVVLGPQLRSADKDARLEPRHDRPLVSCPAVQSTPGTPIPVCPAALPCLRAPAQRPWLGCAPPYVIQKGARCRAGLPPRTPRRMGCRPRCFNPSLPTRHAAGSSLHQRGGTPHPCDRRAISVQLAPATSGLSRSLADTPTRRSGHVEGRSRTDSQADSAGSIPVTRSNQEGPRSKRALWSSSAATRREHSSISTPQCLDDVAQQIFLVFVSGRTGIGNLSTVNHVEG
jgi:hypothetical protein